MMKKIDIKELLPYLIQELEKEQRNAGTKENIVIRFEYNGRRFLFIEEPVLNLKLQIFDGVNQ